MRGYSFDNTLNELLENERTRKVLFSAIPQLEENPMLAQAGGMSFRTIIGFMGGAVPAAFLEQIEARLQEVPFEDQGAALPEVETPDAPYFDSSLPISQRVEDLLGRMTLDEKLAQLCSDFVNSLLGASPERMDDLLHKEHPDGLGRYTQYNIAGLGSPRQAAELANRLQEYYCKHTRLGARELYDEYALPFEASIREAGLASVMTSYSEVDGIPCGMNKALVRGLLRKRLGFDGLVLSDGAAVRKLYDTYHVASSYEEAGLLGIQGGMETEMPVGDSYKKLGEYVRRGELDEALIDEAVRHVLRTKFEAGLFEHPYVEAEECAQRLNTPAARRASQRLAAESLTLLKNEGGTAAEKGEQAGHHRAPRQFFAARDHGLHLPGLLRDAPRYGGQRRGDGDLPRYGGRAPKRRRSGQGVDDGQASFGRLFCRGRPACPVRSGHAGPVP